MLLPGCLTSFTRLEFSVQLLEPQLKYINEAPCFVQAGLGVEAELWGCSLGCTRAAMPVHRGSARSHPVLAPRTHVLLPAAIKLQQKQLHCLQQLFCTLLYLPLLAHPSLSFTYNIFSSQPCKSWARLLCFGENKHCCVPQQWLVPLLKRCVTAVACRRDLGKHWAQWGKGKPPAQLIQTQQHDGEGSEGGWFKMQQCLG